MLVPEGQVTLMGGVYGLPLAPDLVLWRRMDVVSSPLRASGLGSRGPKARVYFAAFQSDLATPSWLPRSRCVIDLAVTQ